MGANSLLGPLEGVGPQLNLNFFGPKWHSTGVVDTGGKLLPVSTTLTKMVAKIAACVVDNGGKFAASVVDTVGNFASSVVDTGGKFANGVVDTGGAS